MNAVTTEQQLKKVMRTSKAISVFLQIANAFIGIGMAFTIIALVFANSFHLNLGNGDLGITFFSQEQAQVVVNVYDNNNNRFGANFDTGVPELTQVAQLETEPGMLLRVTTAALMLMQFGVVLLVLEHLSRLFAHYANGEIFTSAAVARIRKTGFALLGLPVISLLNSTFALVLVSTLPTSGNPGSLHFDVHMTGLFAAVVVITIARIMDVGRAMREENELTI